MKLDKTKPYGTVFTVIKGVNTLFIGQDGYAFDSSTGDMVMDLNPERHVQVEESVETNTQGEAPSVDTESKSETVTCNQCGKQFSVPPKLGRAAAIARVKKHMKDVHSIEVQS